MISRSLFINCLSALVLVMTGFPSIGLAATAPTVTNISPVTTKISTPMRMASDQFSNLYLTDPRAGGINKYDRTGKWIATIPVDSPQGVVVTTGQDLIVSQKSKVTVFSSSGVARFTLKDSQGATFAFKYANGMTIDPATGNIYVADSLDDCILIFTPQGNPIATGVAASGKPANSFGSTGRSTGQFSMPTALAFEKSSRLLAVADTFNGRVQFFDSATNSFQRAIGSLGSGPLAFTSPESVVFEYTAGSSQTLSRMYVLDSFQSRVQVIDPTGSGTFLREIGGYGRGTGKLRNPSDMAFDTVNSRLVVANGLGSLTAYGIDSVTTPIPVDTAPPSPFTVNPTTNFATNQSSLTFSGTVERGAVVVVTVDTAAVVGPVTYSLASSTVNVWSVAVTNLAAGANTFTLSAYDTANNPATLSRVVTFSAANAVALNLNPVITPTSILSQTLSGTVDSGASVTVNGASATVIGTGWTYPATLVDGPNPFTIVGSLAGKTSSTVGTTINVVRTPPQMRVSALSSGSVTAVQLMTIRGTVTVDENFDKVALSVNGATPVALTVTNGTFAAPVILNAGANVITVTASDKALPTPNSAPDSRTINYDPTVGQSTITSPTATDSSITAATTLNLSGTAPGATRVIVSYLSGGNPAATADIPVANSTWSATGINLDPGINPIQVTAYNGTNQISSAILSVTRVTPDQPTLSIAAPATDLTTNSTALSASGSAGAASVTATLDGAPVSVTFTPGTPGSFTLNQGTLLEGANLLAITAVDAFGNSVTSYRSIRVKTSPPANFSLTPFSGQTTTLSGSLEPGSTVFVKDAGGNNLVAPQTVGANGSWTVTLPAAYDPATMNLFAIDPAGNSTRNGRLANDNNLPDITDAISAIRLSIGLNTSTATDLLRGDVAPQVNGQPRPDGKINIFDVIVILEKIIGL